MNNKELFSRLLTTPVQDFFERPMLAILAEKRSDVLTWFQIRSIARQRKVNPSDLEQAVLVYAQPMEEKEVAIQRLDTFLAQDYPVSYVIDRMLPTGGMSILSADPKAGKSTLARNMIYRVSRGESVLGRQTAKTSVLYLSLEEKEDELQKHFRLLGATTEPIYLYVGPIPLERTLVVLAEEIKKHSAGFAVIDPLFDMLALTDTNDYALTNRALKAVLTIARQLNCHIMALHHTAKAGEQGTARAMLGSTALRGATDANLMLGVDHKSDTKTRYFSSEQRYGDAIDEHTLLYDKATGETSLGVASRQRKADLIRQQVLATLATRALSTGELKSTVGGSPNAITTVLKTLCDEGLVTTVRHGKALIYTLSGGKARDDEEIFTE